MGRRNYARKIKEASPPNTASPPPPLQGERGVKCKAKENCIGDDRWKNCIIFNFQSNCELIIVNCELLIDNCKLQNALFFSYKL